MGDRWVVARQTPEGMDLGRDYVALPDNYGTDDYFQREDICLIRKTVFDCLDRLEEHLHFTPALSASARAVIKPNLVSVYHHSGLAGTDYPESTDPRVLDAVVEWVLRFQPNVLIAESSGKPMPTRTSFRVSGVEQIVKFRKTDLVALETCPVRRYLLPKARVMKKVVIPEPFEDVAEYGVQTKQWDIMWIRRCRSAPGGIKWGCRPTQCNHLRPAGIG